MAKLPGWHGARGARGRLAPPAGGPAGGFWRSINDTASISSLHALAAAREAALPEAAGAGLHGAPRGRVYASQEAHSSIAKAAVTLGLGRDGIRHVATDDAFALRPDALAAALAEDRAAGIRPVAVVATVGTTSSTVVDPVAAIASLAEEAGAWLHVDAAYAGAAATAPEFRIHFVGWEWADSVVINPHRWLFTPNDCSVLFCRRPDDLRRAFSLTPEYLRTAEGTGGATNLMDYGVALGRRFRALKLWMVLRSFGAEGIRARIRAHGRRTRGLDRPGPGVGAHGSASVFYGGVPVGGPGARRRKPGRGQRAHHGGCEQDRRGFPFAHPAARASLSACGHRQRAHHAGARRACMGGAAGGCGGRTRLATAAQREPDGPFGSAVARRRRTRSSCSHGGASSIDPKLAAANPQTQGIDPARSARVSPTMPTASRSA